MSEEKKPKKPPRIVKPVRFAEAGIAAIESAAADLGITFSEFVRQAASEKVAAHRLSKIKAKR